MNQITITLLSGEEVNVKVNKIQQYLIYQDVIHIFTKNIQYYFPRTTEVVNLLIQNKETICYN